MPLEYPLETVELGDGTEFQASYQTCTCVEGGSDIFSNYYPTGLDHMHTECRNCGQSYCLANACYIQPVPTSG